MSNEVFIGKTVTFADSHGLPHDALVTQVWGEPDAKPCINLVHVSMMEEKEDSWGRQIERVSSAVHQDSQTAHGNYWKFK